MLLRSTTRSMSRQSPDFVPPDAAAQTSAPARASARFRPASSPQAPCNEASASPVRIEYRLSYSRCHKFGPSALPATQPFADFWQPIPTPPGVSSTRQIARSPRVLRTHLHAYACRIYAAPFRASFGLRRDSPSHPDASPHIRFLFVRPALCLQLPPDSWSPRTPLPFG